MARFRRNRPGLGAALATRTESGGVPDSPLLSIVLPVHGVRQYLDECLDSVLPPGAEVQVIAVDDASPDGCGELLDQRAAADPRLRVIHAERSGGPGSARNAGLALASGAYVWFVDGDDVLPPGAVGAVRARLAGPRPDVLLIGYEDLWPDGSTGPAPGNELLAAAPEGLFSLADAPELINLTMTGWSKIFRREFLVALGEPFRSGIHEDVPVTCAALLAGRLSVLDQPCYRYRRSRPGSYMASSSTAHSAIFISYGEVFNLLDKLIGKGDPVATAEVQSAVFGRAIWHYCSVLSTGGTGFGPVGRPGLVPRRERRAFFRRMHEEYVAHRPDGFTRPGGARGAKFRLVERGAYWSYEVLEPLNRIRVAGRRR